MKEIVPVMPAVRGLPRELVRIYWVSAAGLKESALVAELRFGGPDLSPGGDGVCRKCAHVKLTREVP